MLQPTNFTEGAKRFPKNNDSTNFFNYKSLLNMGENTNVTNMSDQDIITEIDVQQKRIIALFTEVANRVQKKTNGGSFMSNDNANVAEYWLNVGKSHPELIAQICDLSDFSVKIAYFKSLISVGTQDEQIGAILKAPRDAASKDCNWYVSYIRKQVVAQQSNPVYKLILQKEPNPRQYNLKTPAPTSQAA